MTRTWISCASVALACLLALSAHAQNAGVMRKQVEGTMLVTGTIDVTPDGAVVGHALDERGKLPAYAVDLIERAIPALRFEPIPDASRPVRAKMTLRLVATQDVAGDMRIEIRSAHFGEEHPDTWPSAVLPTTRGRMNYPVYAAEVGGKGTVYLLLRIGRDGRVSEAVAEQVNLTALGSAREMAAIRKSLVGAAVRDVTRGWLFSPQTGSDDAVPEFRVARLVVDYAFDGDKPTPYGQWKAYHPGERTVPEWAAPTPSGFSPDVLMAGELTPEGTRFRLATPLGG